MIESLLLRMDPKSPCLLQKQPRKRRLRLRERMLTVTRILRVFSGAEFGTVQREARGINMTLPRA